MLKPVLCAECYGIQHIKRASVVKGLMHREDLKG